jgi:aspartate/methionine/tyrosine aminotransferase
VRLNPVLAGMQAYPFVRLAEAKRATAARGIRVIDFGIGEPREETPAFIRRALTRAIDAEPISTYPVAEGLPELREAVAGWAGRRFGATLDPDSEVVPTMGSKEAIFHLAQVVAGHGDRVAVTTPGYPVPSRGALFAGAELMNVALDPQSGWQPDLDAVDWEGIALLWLNFPNNPTAATATLELYERAAALAQAHGFVLASDEAYSELWFSGDPPVSALQLADRTNVVVFNTLSKRSSMPGYRSGFAAGDTELMAALRRYRPNVGVAPQTFIQRAAVAAWSD